jgi:hypothetical protein
MSMTDQIFIGDRVRITFIDGQFIEGVLTAVFDDTIYCELDGELIEMHYSSKVEKV